jgi:hypothetical protein
MVLHGSCLSALVEAHPKRRGKDMRPTRVKTISRIGIVGTIGLALSEDNAKGI